MYSHNHDFSPFIQRELILLAVHFWQVFVLMENYCIMCLYLCMHMIFTNTATSAEIFTCIITFLSPVLISFKIEYICILQEWWTTRFKHVVKWLRWLVGLSGQAVWQTVRGHCTGTCWWIALHIFTLYVQVWEVSMLILEQHSSPMINANEAKYKLDLRSDLCLHCTVA